MGRVLGQAVRVLGQVARAHWQATVVQGQAAGVDQQVVRAHWQVVKARCQAKGVLDQTPASVLRNGVAVPRFLHSECLISLAVTPPCVLERLYHQYGQILCPSTSRDLVILPMIRTSG